MLFKHIERELMDGEPWAADPINKIEGGYQIRDCWEIENQHKNTLTQRLFMKNPRLWFAWLSWKSLF